MNLKTSLFNKMIIKSDLKRFWWVSALNAITILIFAVYTRFERYLRGYRYDFYPEANLEFYHSPIYSILTICIPIIIAFCGFTSIMLSLYLNSVNSVSFMHGLPLKRKTHFASHFLSGIILVISPAIVNAVIMAFMRLTPQLSQYVTNMHILKWLYCYVIYALVVYSGTTFVTLITGNSFAAIGVAAGIAVMPLIITGFITVLFEETLYGYYGSEIHKWLEYVYLEPSKLFKPYCLIYLALILILIFGGYFVYKVRHLENHGEVIAFPELKPVFIYTVAVVLGFLGYLYCTSVSSNSSLWWILVFGLLGVIIAFMLSKKAFTLKGSLRPIVIYTCCFAILFCVMKFDLTGYEKRIPNISKIDGITLQSEGFEGRSGSAYHPTAGNYEYSEIYNAVLTKKEDLENVIELHKYLIENREINDNEIYFSLPICYKLTNGREILREYSVPRNACYEYLKKLFETKEMKAYDYAVYDPTQKEIIEVTVADESLCGNTMSFYENDKELLNRFEVALKKDIENLKYEDNYYRNAFAAENFTHITFRYIKPAKGENGEALTEEQLKEIPMRSTYTINSNYVNTVALLNEIGFYNNPVQLGEIKAVGVNFYKEDTDGRRVTTRTEVYYEDIKESSGKLSEFEYVINNPEEAFAIYEFVKNESVYDTNQGSNHVLLGFETENGVWQCTLMYNENIPEIIRNILDDMKK